MKQGVKRGLLILGGLAGLSALVYYSGIGQYLKLESLQKQSGALKLAVEHHYFHSVIVFMLIYTLFIMCTIPVVGPLTMLGGYLFGIVPGFVYSLTASTLGAMLSFLIIRYALSSLLRNRYKEQLALFQEKMLKHGYSYLLMLQLLSVIPFVVINTLAAVTHVPLLTLFITTLIGTAPLLFVYSWAGKQFGTISSMQDIFSPQLLLIMFILALFSLLPILLKKWLSKD
jgi:uncharacterized membrane protein YdjX (TVP38/TMEM64 family)